MPKMFALSLALVAFGCSSPPEGAPPTAPNPLDAPETSLPPSDGGTDSQSLEASSDAPKEGGADVGSTSDAPDTFDVGSPVDSAPPAKRTVKCQVYTIGTGWGDIYECGDGVYPSHAATVSWYNGAGTEACNPYPTSPGNPYSYTVPTSGSCGTGDPGTATAGACSISYPAPSSVILKGWCRP
jgi:hypothetical protein